MRRILTQNLILVMAAFMSMPMLVSAQDDLLPPPDMLFEETIEPAKDAAVVSEMLETVFETVDELPPVEELPALEELPVVEDNTGIQIQPSSPVQILDEAPTVVEDTEVVEEVIVDSEVVEPAVESNAIEEVVEPVKETVTSPEQIVAPEVEETEVEVADEVVVEEEVKSVEQNIDVAPVKTEQIHEEIINTAVVTPTETVVSNTPMQAQASTEKSINEWIINVNAGSNLFYGDIRVNDFMPVFENNNESKYAAGLIIGNNINESVQLRGQVLFGQLSGTRRVDNAGNPVNVYFDASIFEYNANVKYSIPATDALTFYTHIGLGFVHFRTQLKDLNTDVVRASYGYKGTEKDGATVETVVPLGFGFDYKLNNDFSLNADISLRVVNTDKLDGRVSSSSSLFQDMYGYSSIGLTYNIGKKQVTQQVAPAPVAVEMDEPVVDTILEEPIVEVVSEPILDSIAIEVIEPDVATQEIAANVVASKPIETPIIEIVDMNNTPAPKPVAQVEVVEEDDVIYKIVEPNIPSTPTATVAPVQNKGFADASATQGLVYRIQIVAVTTQKDNKVTQLKKLYNLDEVIYEDVVGQWYKYTVGNYSSLQEAINYRKVLISKGMKDSFIVPFYNGKRITLQEAKQIK